MFDVSTRSHGTFSVRISPSQVRSSLAMLSLSLLLFVAVWCLIELFVTVSADVPVKVSTKALCAALDPSLVRTLTLPLWSHAQCFATAIFSSVMLRVLVMLLVPVR